jgi:arylsulfatase A-like enzyme
MSACALFACLLKLLTLVAAERTNDVIIFADDIGYSDRSGRGGIIIPASNVDALVAGGVR